MKQYIYVLAFISVVFSGSLKALTPVSRGKIQELTKAIREGKVKGNDIIQQIKALNIPATDRESIINDLDRVAVTALQKEKYPGINATTKLVQGIRENKITVVQAANVPTVEKPADLERDTRQHVVLTEGGIIMPVGADEELSIVQSDASIPATEQVVQPKEQVAPQVEEYVNKKYTKDALIALRQKVGFDKFEDADPYNGQTSQYIMISLDSVWINALYALQNAKQSTVLKTYYILQLAKNYIQAGDDDTVKTENVKSINMKLKQLLLKRNDSDSLFAWQMVQKFETENVKLFDQPVKPTEAKQPILTEAKPEQPKQPIISTEPKPVSVTTTPLTPPVPFYVIALINLYASKTYTKEDLIAFCRFARGVRFYYDPYMSYDAKAVELIKADLEKMVSNHQLYYFTEVDPKTNMIRIFDDYRAYKLAQIFLPQKDQQQQDAKLLTDVMQHLRDFLGVKLSDGKYIVEIIDEKTKEYEAL